MTEKDSWSRLEEQFVQGSEGELQANPQFTILSADDESPVNLSFQEKLLWLIYQVPVPQTDTGGRGENLKTREITLVKELGKMTP